MHVSHIFFPSWSLRLVSGKSLPHDAHLAIAAEVFGGVASPLDDSPDEQPIKVQKPNKRTRIGTRFFMVATLQS